MCPVEGPLSAQQVESLDTEAYVASGSYATKRTSARAFIDVLSSFVLQTMQGEEVNDDDINVLESSFAQLVVSIIDGFSQVFAERDSNDDACCHSSRSRSGA